MYRSLSAVCLLLALLICGVSLAETDAAFDAPVDASELAQRIEELKLQSVNLARDLWLLEQDLGDAQSRLVVFVSVDPLLDDHRLEEIELQLSDETIAQHSYAPAESDALNKGGSHRVYSASLAPGRHVLQAQLAARGPAGRINRSAKLSFSGGHLGLQGFEPRAQACMTLHRGFCIRRGLATPARRDR